MDQHRGTTNKPSNSDLLSSAKLLADAAKSTFSHEPGNKKADKAKVAGAAANVLGAAKHYGKFEEKSFGKYVDKAEGYLHKYSSSGSHSTTSTGSTAAGSGVHGESHGVGEGKHDQHSGSQSHAGGEGKHGQGHSSSGGGYGEYVKLAQGLLKKQDGHGGNSADGGHGHSSGGAGDYIKLAQGLMKKH